LRALRVVARVLGRWWWARSDSNQQRVSPESIELITVLGARTNDGSGVV
jgi:hypothetical protein